MWATYHDVQALSSYCELAVTALADSADSTNLDDQCIGVKVNGGGTTRGTPTKFRIRDTWSPLFCVLSVLVVLGLYLAFLASLCLVLPLLLLELSEE